MTAERLLADLLNEQVDESVPEALDDMTVRWAAAIRQDEPLHKRDIQLIWSSPLARRAFLEVRREIVAEISALWLDWGIGSPLELRAAATQVDHLTAAAEWGTVKAARIETGEWVVTVDVNETALATIPRALKLRIFDDGGLVWFTLDPARGRRGEMWWTEAETPLDRLQRHRLMMEIV